MVLISAHRCGAGRHLDSRNTAVALRRALDFDCEYVEFDLQRTADRVFVLCHDPQVTVDGSHRRVSEVTLDELRRAVPTVTTYDEALSLLRGRKKAHVDLKFVTTPTGQPELGGDVAAAARAVEVLGPDNVVVTTLEDQSVRAIRSWALSTHPQLRVGLALGRSRRGLPWRRQLSGLLSELFPARRVRACDANLVVAHHWLATFGVARWAARQGLPLLVWTVDGRWNLRRWLRDERAWMVASNHPQRAVEIRRRLRA